MSKVFKRKTANGLSKFYYYRVYGGTKEKLCCTFETELKAARAKANGHTSAVGGGFNVDELFKALVLRLERMPQEDRDKRRIDFGNRLLRLQAETLPFARTIVNSGRLSVPCTYDGSVLNGPDASDLPTRTRPGSPCPDAPLEDGWLLARLDGFTLLTIDTDAPDSLTALGVTLPRLAASARDNPALRSRYLGDAPQAIYLIRPDQHVAARWTRFDAGAVAAALARAIGKE